MAKRNQVKIRIVDRSIDVVQAVRRAVPDPLLKCAQAVEATAKRSMRKGGQRGRVGPRGGRVQESSAPGTPPHVQMGALRASIASALDEETSVAGPLEKYGKWHEFGTRMLPARPFMRPALLLARKKFARFFRGLKLR